jgi:hypothetical protein
MLSTRAPCSARRSAQHSTAARSTPGPPSHALPPPVQDLWDSAVAFVRSLWEWLLEKVGVKRYHGLGDTEELNYFQPLGDAGDTQAGGGNRFTL